MIEGKIYDGVVVYSADNDRYSGGSVRAIIYGWSDSLPDYQQPWVSPVGGTTQKVPAIGTPLKIYFEDNDPAMPMYLVQGVESNSFLHDTYRNEYPNTTVTDMGEILTRSNKSTHEFVEENIQTGYSRLVDSKQKTEIQTTNGFSTIDNERATNSRVVTEDTVNVMTGRPIRQGSEFYKVPTFEESQIQTGNLGV